MFALRRRALKPFIAGLCSSDDRGGTIRLTMGGSMRYAPEQQNKKPFQ